MALPKEYRQISFLVWSAVMFLVGITLALGSSLYTLLAPHASSLAYAFLSALLLSRVKHVWVSLRSYFIKSVPSTYKRTALLILALLCGVGGCLAAGRLVAVHGGIRWDVVAATASAPSASSAPDTPLSPLPLEQSAQVSPFPGVADLHQRCGNDNDSVDGVGSSVGLDDASDAATATLPRSHMALVGALVLYFVSAMSVFTIVQYVLGSYDAFGTNLAIASAILSTVLTMYGLLVIVASELHLLRTNVAGMVPVGSDPLVGGDAEATFDSVLADLQARGVGYLRYACEAGEHNLPLVVTSGLALADKCAAAEDVIRSESSVVWSFVSGWALSRWKVFVDTLFDGFANVMSLAWQLSETVYQFMVYMFSLYYFLRYEEKLGAEMQALVPITPDELDLVYGSLHNSVTRTFIMALILCIFHASVTALTFFYAGFRVIWIFSILSGILAIVPLFSSWLIWFPASVFLLVSQGVWSLPWVIVAVFHSVGFYVGDYAVYIACGIDQQRPEVIGMAFIFGVYAYGWQGVLIGPMIAAMCLSFIAIYKTYIVSAHETVDGHEVDDESGSSSDDLLSSSTEDGLSTAGGTAPSSAHELAPSRWDTTPSAEEDGTASAEPSSLRKRHRSAAFRHSMGDSRSRRGSTSASDAGNTPSLFDNLIDTFLSPRCSSSSPGRRRGSAPTPPQTPLAQH